MACVPDAHSFFACRRLRAVPLTEASGRSVKKLLIRSSTGLNITKQNMKLFPAIAAAGNQQGLYLPVPKSY